MPDLLLRLIGEDSASGAFDSASNAMKQAAGEFVKFADQSIKAFEQQEKADRQLARAAGELTDVFKRQATAMQEQLGVSDDMVQGIQTMLLRFGEAPASVEATTRAILDYSAATGEDAVSATRTLLTGVQAGKTVFKDLGLEYEKTGSAAKDLEHVTDALAKKIGGAAAAEADSLEGQTRKAKEQLGELQEQFGALISDVVVGTGALTTITTALKDFGAGIRILTNKADPNSIAELGTQLKIAGSQLEDFKKIGMSSDDPAYRAQLARIAELQKAILQFGVKKMNVLGGRSSPDALPEDGTDRKTAKGASAGAAAAAAELKANYEATQSWMADEEQMESDNRSRRLESENKYFAEVSKIEAKAAEDSEKLSAKREEEAVKAAEEKEKTQLDRLRAQMKHMAEVTLREGQNFKQQMMAMGEQIGEVFVHTLASALQEALDGGEVDILGMVADIGFGVAAIVGEVVGSIANPFVGKLIGSAIGAAGQIVHHERAKAWQREQGSKHHDGGWIDLERWHDGSWGMSSDEQLIIAQRGERMLSRQEVGAMGGKQAVDAAARGHGGAGGGVHVHIQAQDALSVREFFEDRGGRGFYNALRTGRGSLAQLLRR